MGYGSVPELYISALDSILLFDNSSDIASYTEYIAIDIKSMDVSSENDKEYIREYFKKYDVPVIFESFLTLRDKDMVGENNSIKGILLSVDRTVITGNHAVIEGSTLCPGPAPSGSYASFNSRMAYGL